MMYKFTLLVCFIIISFFCSFAQTGIKSSSFKQGSLIEEKTETFRQKGFNLPEIPGGHKKRNTQLTLLENGFLLETSTYQLYDGSGWINLEAEMNTYDTQFNLVETVNKIWNTGGWLNTERILFTYTTSGSIESRTEQIWNNSQWEDQNKSEYVYDNSGRVTEITQLTAQGSGSFLEVSKDIYTYDDNPHTITVESRQFNGSEWENLYLNISYYTDNKVTEILSLPWNGTEYQLHDRSLFEYSNGLLVSITAFIRNNEVWDSVSRQLYEYDGQLRIVNYLSQNYDQSSQTWKNLYRFTNTYFGNDSSLVITQRNNENNEWENLFKVISYFDNSNRINSAIYYEWGENNWNPEVHIEYIYDASGLNTEYVESYMEGNVWVPYGRALFTYIPGNPSNTDNDFVINEFKLLQNYPNPFNPGTEIMYVLPVSADVSLKIYDITGREITELINGVKEAGIHKVTFNASGFASGVYFYSLVAISENNIAFKSVNKMILLK